MQKGISSELGFLFCSCGEGGIRTPGTSQYVGFQDRCNRPLCHLSKGFCVKECGLSVFDVAKVYQKSEPCKRMTEKFENNFIFTVFCFLFLFIDCLIL